jgi:hypothetical protein
MKRAVGLIDGSFFLGKKFLSWMRILSSGCAPDDWEEITALKKRELRALPIGF